MCLSFAAGKNDAAFCAFEYEFKQTSRQIRGFVRAGTRCQCMRADVDRGS